MFYLLVYSTRLYVYATDLWLKNREAKSVCVCVAVRRPLRVLRREKRETCTFEFVLVWVYFERKSFESGFRDLTLRCKVLRESSQEVCRSCPELGWNQFAVVFGLFVGWFFLLLSLVDVALNCCCIW